MNATESSTDTLAPVVSLVVATIITVPGLSLSIFLMIVLLKSRNLHTLENFLLVHLITFDFVNGVDFFGYVIFLNVRFNDKDYERLSCFIIHVVTTGLNSAQFLATCTFTVDRFIKIVYPFTYNKICTKKNLITLVAVCHSYTLLQLIGTVKLFEWDGQDLCLFYFLSPKAPLAVMYGLMLIAIGILLAMNLKIVLVARRQRREIMVQSSATEQTQTSASSDNSKNTGQVLGILTLFTFVTYLPAWMFSALVIAGVDTDAAAFRILAFIALILWNCNTLVDSLAFLFCRKDVKCCAFQIWRSMRSE